MKKLVILPTLFLLITGCVPTAKYVAKQFWQGVQNGDAESIRPFVTSSSYPYFANPKQDFKKSDVTLGHEVIEEDRATVDTNLKDENGLSYDFKTILVKENGRWKVDMVQTMSSMLGSAMKEIMDTLGNTMVQGLGNAVKGFSEGLHEGLQGIDKKPDSEK